MLLVSPYHPSFTENGILIQAHPQQGRRTLDEHFCRCEFYYYGQRCYLNTNHNWVDEFISFVFWIRICIPMSLARSTIKRSMSQPVSTSSRALL